MKVAFIGLGNMGSSLAKAVAKEVANTDLLLVNRSPQKVQEFISQYGGTASDLEQAFQEAEVIFLGVKPYQICPLLRRVPRHLGLNAPISCWFPWLQAWNWSKWRVW